MTSDYSFTESDSGTTYTTAAEYVPSPKKNKQAWIAIIVFLGSIVLVIILMEVFYDAVTDHFVERAARLRGVFNRK